MVLGLIDFLLGGKRKTKVPRSGQVANPLQRGSQDFGASEQSAGNVPDGQSNPTVNAAQPQFVSNDANAQKEENKQDTGSSQPQSQQAQSFPVRAGNPTSVSEVINKLHKEMKTTNERVGELVSEIKTVEGTVSSLGHKIDDLEEAKKQHDEKLEDINNNMGKFLSLYEVINNQYNPFVEEDGQKQPIQVNANGASENQGEGGTNENQPAIKQVVVEQKKDDVDALLELDTLNIEEAAADAVPLTKLKNSTNSLVVILSWLEYLVKKVGIEEARNSLRYYTEVLRWTTPEVFFDLDKYLRGMKDAQVKPDSKLTVRDHIVSLYFISKLNEKSLDEKLTKAVLQIIKE